MAQDRAALAQNEQGQPAGRMADTFENARSHGGHPQPGAFVFGLSGRLVLISLAWAMTYLPPQRRWLGWLLALMIGLLLPAQLRRPTASEAPPGWAQPAVAASAAAAPWTTRNLLMLPPRAASQRSAPLGVRADAFCACRARPDHSQRGRSTHLRSELDIPSVTNWAVCER